MSKPDEYTKPEGPHQRNNRQDSHGTHYETVSEDSLYAILSRLTRELGGYPNFYYETQQAIDLHVRDERGHDATAKADAVVLGRLFGKGVFRANGGIHRTHKHRLRDPVQKERLEKMGYWVEDLSNAEAVKESVVRERLEPHRRKVDEYGGAV